jgi:hypothetical protein
VSQLRDFAASTEGFYRKSAVNQLLDMALFLEARQQQPCFEAAQMRQCFREVSVDPPDMSVYLPRIAAKKPPQLIKEKGGYRLSGALRRDDLPRFFGPRLA